MRGQDDSNITCVKDRNASEVKTGLKESEPHMESEAVKSPSTTGVNEVQRRLKRSDGIYIEGEIEGVPVTFTADTGATRSIISPRIYNSISKDRRPVLQKSVGLSGVSGLPLKLHGCNVFEIKLGGLDIKHELIVAEVEDEGLIGMDVLFQGKDGPADILLSEGKIRLHGVSIPCISIGLPEKVRKVVIAEKVVVPGNSEMIVDAFIERTDDDKGDQSEVLIEPSGHFEERYQLRMAASLADIRHHTSHKVRIMNPFNESREISQDSVIGFASEIERIEGVIPHSGGNNQESSPLDTSHILVTNENKPLTDSSRTPVRRLQETVYEVPSHLTELYTKSSKTLTEFERDKVKQMLQAHSDTFSKDEFDIGMTTLTEHVIDVGSQRPIKQPPRRVPTAFADEEEKVIKQLEEQGIIRASTSPWASPIVLVRKKSGKIRPCVDYRRLNAVTIKDAFPLPRITDCLDAVADATMFSCFDVTSGYHQIPVKESDVPKTAFCTKYGLYEYTSMPMGLTNSPTTFQRLMELALRGLQWHTCLIYLDDIVVFGKTFDEHLQRVEEVLDRIKAAGLKLKPEKCQLFQREVDFLGHLVSADGIKPNPHNIAKIKQWPKPSNVTEVRRILGMGNYYRRFVKDYAKLVSPLTHLTKKGVNFAWTPTCEEAFETLKQTLIGSNIMAYPCETGQYILDTDASDSQIAGILSQIQDGQERVISYGSRTLGNAEKNYCITDKELLAIRHFVEYYRQYLLGRTFVVRSDHQALVWLFRLKEPKGRIARWIELLSEYDFSIEYRSGNKHANADALSRCPNPWDCQCSEVDNLEALRCGPCKKCQKRTTDMKGVEDSEKEEDGKIRSVEFNPEMQAGGQTQANVRETSEQEESKPTVYPSAISEQNDWPGLDPAFLHEKQKLDPDIRFILDAFELGVRPQHSTVVAKSPECRHYWSLWQSLELHNRVLYKRFHQKGGIETYLQVIVPKECRESILFHMHNSIVSGHLGEKKTRVKLLKRFYWYNLRNDVQTWVKSCLECQANKKPAKRPRAALGTMPVGSPFDRLALDYLGPFPITPRGNRYILVCIDQFSKWVEIFPLPDQSATRCANTLLNEVISRFGTPLSIHSDQGRNFESLVFQELCLEKRVRQSAILNATDRSSVSIEPF